MLLITLLIYNDIDFEWDLETTFENARLEH